MSFEKRLLGLGTFAILIGVACTDYLHGKKQGEEILNVDVRQTTCLRDLPGVVVHFFDDQSSVGEIDQSFDCLEKSLQTFVRFTRGVAPGQYSDKEIQYFFNRYLLAENQISDSFMLELMKLKTFAVGGSRRSFTRIEIDQFAAYLNIVREQVRSLNGLNRLIFFRYSDGDPSEDQLRLAQAKVEKAVAALILESKVANSEFEFSDVQLIMDQLHRFVGAKSKLDHFVKWFPLVNSVKELFLGNHTQLVTASEWKQNITWSVQTYFLGLQYYYHLRRLDLQKPQGWESLIAFLDKAFRQVGNSPELLSRGMIDTDKIDSMIDQLYMMKIISIPVELPVLKNAYKKSLYHFVDGQSRIVDEIPEVTFFNRSQFIKLENEYQVWRLTQHQLDLAFQRRVDLSRGELSQLLRKGAAQTADILKALANEKMRAAWNEWLAIFEQTRPVVMTSDQRLSLDFDPHREKFSFSGLSTMNFLRTATRMVMRGYGVDGGISERRLVDLERDFRELGLDLKFLDPRKTDAAQRTFKEANFFTFSGNGNNLMSWQETFELLNFMYSGAGTISTAMRNEVEIQGGLTNEIDSMRNRKLNEQTLKKVLRAKGSMFFSNMPGLCAFLQHLDEHQWESLYQSVLFAVRSPDAVSGRVEFSELQGFVSILQYVESLFVQFDQDRSGGLSVAELRVAEPRFHEFIKKISGYQSDRISQEAFIYLAFYGKKPTSLSDVLGFGWARIRSQLGEASRLHLYKVLGILKSDAK